MSSPSDVSGTSDESGHSLVPSSNKGLNFRLALTYSLQEVNHLLRTYFIFFSFRYDKKVNYLITMTQKVYKLYERSHSTCRCRGWILTKVASPTKMMMSKKSRTQALGRGNIIKVLASKFLASKSAIKRVLVDEVLFT